MFAKTLVTFASLLAAVQAISITAPKLDAEWDLSKTNTIEWKSVDTDPKNFTIVLVDQSSSSGQKSTEVAKLVKTSDDKYSLTNFVAPPGDKYQINFLGTDEKNQGIIAQSQQFKVTKSGVKSTSSSSSAPSATGTDTPAATSAKPNGAATLGQTFGVAAPVVAALYMLI